MMTRTIGLLSLLTAIAGCGSGAGNSDAAAGADLSMRRSTDMALHGPGGTASFAQDVKPIMQFRGCFAHHMTTTWNPVEALTANADIVNFLTTTHGEECKAGGLTLIKAGDSANSYLYQKVNGSFSASCGSDTGVRMPQGGPYLFDYELATIKLWIDAGASNN
jgi:hypothetical protein